MSLNDNFCMLPFMVLSCRPNGKVKTCSQAQNSNGVPNVNLNEDNLWDAWNSDFMIDFRKRKIAGERIPQCEGCKRVEEQGGRSKRMNYNDRYFDKYKHLIQPVMDKPPVWWEFRLSSVCNSACRICTPVNSTLIAKEHKKHYDMIPEYDRLQLKAAGKMLDDNFLNQFWENVEHIEYIELHGGEPFIDERVLSTIDRLIDEGHAQRMHMHVHSNINKYDEKLNEKLNQFKSGWFGVSIDAYGDENDFLRWPAKWETVNQNFNKVKLHKNWAKTILASLTAYQCLTVDKLIDWWLPHQEECGLIFYAVHAPDRFAVEMIDIQDRIIMADYLESYKEVLIEEHKSSFDSLINTLRSERIPDSHEYEQFVMYNDAMDKIRKQNSLELFPHIRQIYETSSAKIFAQ